MCKRCVCQIMGPKNMFISFKSVSYILGIYCCYLYPFGAWITLHAYVNRNKVYKIHKYA